LFTCVCVVLIIKQLKLTTDSKTYIIYICKVHTSIYSTTETILIFLRRSLVLYFFVQLFHSLSTLYTTVHSSVCISD
uniref:Uncharacterized protein n=1 Tax=Ciona intestinalis TaxID=7719 RepID=H2XW19_CIOIN